MADKVAAGQAPPRSAAMWNNIIDSANEYAERRRLGNAGGLPKHSIPTDIVRVKNACGSAIRLGEVLEFSSFLLSDLTRGAIWLEGDTPNATRAYGIALQDIPVDSIDRMQVSGACPALVNVSDTDHGYAEVVSGSVVLRSTSLGEVRLLSPPGSTGEQLCAVLLGGSGIGTDCNTVRFIVQSYTASTRTAIGAVLSKPVGCSAVPDSILGGLYIEICDPQGCHFNRPLDEIMDSHGWARYQMPTQVNFCQTDPAYLVPQWEVVNLCCHVPACEE